MPSEIVGGRRGQSAIELALSKTLLADISNQSKKTVAIVSFYASNFLTVQRTIFDGFTSQYF